MTRASFDDALAAAEDLHRSHPEVSQFTAWDDVSNMPLNPDMVKAAREVEMEYFKKLIT